MISLENKTYSIILSYGELNSIYNYFGNISGIDNFTCDCYSHGINLDTDIEFVYNNMIKMCKEAFSNYGKLNGEE